MVGRVVRLLSALSVVTGMFLTVVGMVEGPTASAQTNVVGQVADATGNLSEYSICQGPVFGPVLSGTASSVVCSERGKPGGDDIQGAVAVDGNFQGVDFYVGKHLSGSVVLSVAGSIGGTVNIQSPGNIGVYGGQNLAQLPAVNCATPGNCPTPNLVNNPALQPSYNTINQNLQNLSNSLTGTAQTGTATYSATYRTLRLVGTANDVNTFYVDAFTLSQTANLYITVPPGSSTIINVNGSIFCSASQPCLQNVFYWNGTAFEGGNQYNSPVVEQLRASTLINLPCEPLIGEAPLNGGPLGPAALCNPEHIVLDSSGPAINFLAPWADFIDNNSVFYGFVYANQVNGDFQNDLPGGGPTPSTTTTTTTTTVPTTSTTVPTTSTTVPSTTVPSTTVPSTTVPSTTVPSTTVPSTTVPSTTVPSTTVPSTTTTRPTTTTTRPTTTTTRPTTTTTTTRPTTTTTRPTTTTTRPTTTTTTPATTTTTKPQKPVTKAKSGGTTTTLPTLTTTTAVTTTVPVTKGASGTTTVPSTTTTKVKRTTSTTSPSATTTTTVASLAYTGTSSAGPLTGAGLALIVAGGLVMGLSTRRRRLA